MTLKLAHMQMDLYVIIEIGDDENVTIITAYPEEKKRREHERKH